MTYKSIPVKPETHKRITALMSKSETYDSFLNKLINERESIQRLIVQYKSDPDFVLEYLEKLWDD
jgi:hypothetical protein